MYFEKLSVADLESFIGKPVFSVTNLESTSFASNGDSCYLIKAKYDNNLIRYYANDFLWLDAQDVNSVKDKSVKFQGFILAKLNGTTEYSEYYNVLKGYYSKKHAKKCGKNIAMHKEMVEKSLEEVETYVKFMLINSISKESV